MEIRPNGLGLAAVCASKILGFGVPGRGFLQGYRAEGFRFLVLLGLGFQGFRVRGLRLCLYGASKAT